MEPYFDYLAIKFQIRSGFIKCKIRTYILTCDVSDLSFGRYFRLCDGESTLKFNYYLCIFFEAFKKTFEGNKKVYMIIWNILSQNTCPYRALVTT